MDSIRTRNIQTVKQFLSLLEQERIEDFVDLFAENGRQINPFASGLFPDEIVGKQALQDFWLPVPGRFDGMKFPIKEIYPMHDPHRVLVTFRGEIKLKNNAGYYNNDYICLFKFDDEGKITEYTEIFNPLIVVKAFGLKDQL